MINFNLTNSIQYIYSNFLNFSNVPVETSSVTFTSYVLFSLLLVSLGLTFHNKSTTVHKVLGLLLTSIFVVFLWMLQSQFLFIYIVYILAFISAVLILFLSVVLILPISTLTSKNMLTDKNNKSSYVVIALLSSDDTAASINFKIAAIIFILDFILSLRHRLIQYTWAKVCSDFLEYFQYQFGIIFSIPESNVFCEYHITSGFVKDFINNVGFIKKIYQMYLQVGVKAWNNKVKFPNKYVYLYLIILLTLANLLIIATYLNLLGCKNFILEFIHYIIQILKINFALSQNTRKVLFDVLIQTCLLTSVILSMMFTFLSEQSILLTTTNELNNETLQGLAQIKVLLYGDFSLFLLFSTIVLLIALLGAAIMTRSKR